jgi:hypothetical protein
MKNSIKFDGTLDGYKKVVAWANGAPMAFTGDELIIFTDDLNIHAQRGDSIVLNEDETFSVKVQRENV